MMRRRQCQRVKPDLERFEPRELLSGIIATMAATSLHPTHSSRNPATISGASSSTGFIPSSTSIALPTNQGPQGVNLALTQTGNLTPKEMRRQQFAATFTGTYAIGPGRTDTEAKQTYIRGVGGSNQFLHGDIQIRIITPVDPATPLGGVSAIFDRSINSNSTLGLDLTAPQTSVDSRGRPNNLSISLDTNESAGVYDEGYATGIMSIRYIPSAVRTPGTLEQGKVIVKIRGQIYTTGVDFILTNTLINPGGPSQGGPNNHPI